MCVCVCVQGVCIIPVRSPTSIGSTSAVNSPIDSILRGMDRIAHASEVTFGKNGRLL